MTRNAQLLRRVADYLEAHPRQHEQASWGTRTPCRTVACIAGWAVILNGAPRPAADEDETIWWFRVTEQRGSEYAAELLGLSPRAASRLFDEGWCPANGLSVPDALRRLADGATIAEVSR